MPEQTELFEANTRWFHVFKSMIDSGDLAAMSGSSVKVYLVIKAFTDYQTGQAFPSIDTIASATGLSTKQVKREITSLVSAGYIDKKKQGRSNVYTLREKVVVSDEFGRPAAVATWDYLPTSVQEAVADLRNVLVTGKLGDAKVVHIERLNVQLNTGNATGYQVNIEDMEQLLTKHPELLEKLLNIRGNLKG